MLFLEIDDAEGIWSWVQLRCLVQCHDNFVVTLNHFVSLLQKLCTLMMSCSISSSYFSSSAFLISLSRLSSFASLSFGTSYSLFISVFIKVRKFNKEQISWFKPESRWLAAASSRPTRLQDRHRRRLLGLSLLRVSILLVCRNCQSSVICTS